MDAATLAGATRRNPSLRRTLEYVLERLDGAPAQAGSDIGALEDRIGALEDRIGALEAAAVTDQQEADA